MYPYEQYKGKIIYRGKPIEIVVQIIEVDSDDVLVRLLSKVTNKLKKYLVLKLPKENWDSNMELIKPYNPDDDIPSFLK